MAVLRDPGDRRHLPRRGARLQAGRAGHRAVSPGRHGLYGYAARHRLHRGLPRRRQPDLFELRAVHHSDGQELRQALRAEGRSGRRAGLWRQRLHPLSQMEGALARALARRPGLSVLSEPKALAHGREGREDQPPTVCPGAGQTRRLTFPVQGRFQRGHIVVEDSAGRSRGNAFSLSSFYRVVPEHKRLELGKTWIGAPYRRTHINTAAKYLMLNHAFETISANRVELNTDARNVRSQRAIERLGAVRDGVLRCHTIMRDGFVRDTVNYSFTMRDWPATKVLLGKLLEERTS